MRQLPSFAYGNTVSLTLEVIVAPHLFLHVRDKEIDFFEFEFEYAFDAFFLQVNQY